MTVTRVFKSGNSQAVRLPKEFAVQSKVLEIIREREFQRIPGLKAQNWVS